MDISTSNNNFQKKPNLVLGLESMPGLLEVEPIAFYCLYGSEHIKVESYDFYELKPTVQFSLLNSHIYKSTKADLIKKTKNEPESNIARVNFCYIL